ncbi:MAG: excinuclease ABC subunit B [Clostridiales bacterium]|jgi:protein arginine kinase activator|nr:excinuclease ABC subunit B [Clostridiales bacterium]
MLCERCHKRDAKLFYTEIINGTKKEQHLCEECAAEYTSFQMEKPLLNTELTLGDLLSTLLDTYTTGSKRAGNNVPSVTCNQCGTSFEEFMKNGNFGCANCYRSFHDQLTKTLKSVQGSDVHTGKRPKGFETSMDRLVKNMTEVEKLTIKLQEAIEKEEYEQAAIIRDRIRALRKEETNV